jgi:hypothetical protein
MRGLPERHEIIGEIDGRIILAMALDERLTGLAEVILQARKDRPVPVLSDTTFGEERNAGTGIDGELEFRLQVERIEPHRIMLSDTDAPIVREVIRERQLIGEAHPVAARAELVKGVVVKATGIDASEGLDAEPPEIGLCGQRDFAEKEVCLPAVRAELSIEMRKAAVDSD